MRNVAEYNYRVSLVSRRACEKNKSNDENSNKMSSDREVRREVSVNSVENRVRVEHVEKRIHQSNLIRDSL
jgi:hypothetical protein